MNEGPFCSDALQLNKRGMVVLPIEPGGKKPVVQKWNKWETQKEQSVLAFAQQFREANLALICGASGLTVIDLDDPTLLEYAIQRFGDTPLQVTTHSGGIHLYYRNNGEGCPQSIRNNEGLKIDVRGNGGYVLAPPSVIKGNHYRITKGSWESLKNLPVINEMALTPKSAILQSPFGQDREATNSKKSISKMIEGDGRNDTLFTWAIDVAIAVEDFDELKSRGFQQNDKFAEPLASAEVEKILGSIWNIKETGNLHPSKTPYVSISHSEMDSLGSGAINLQLVLKRNHSIRQKKGQSFAIACQAMAKANVIRGWTPYKYRLARDELIDIGIIQFVGCHPQKKRLKLYDFVIRKN